MKYYKPDWPTRSVIERVAEEMQISVTTKHWSWDGRAAGRQSRANTSARKKAARVQGQVAQYLRLMNLI